MILGHSTACDSTPIANLFAGQFFSVFDPAGSDRDGSNDYTCSIPVPDINDI